MGRRPGNRKGLYNKWYKTKALLRRRELGRYVPVTKRMTRDSLRSMLKRYRMVYIKPNVGSLGIGVMRVELTGSRKKSWVCRSGAAKKRFRTYEEAYRSIRRDVQDRPYLVQKGIRMLRYKNRPFDMRVVVQRRPSSPWRMTGMAARLAHPAKVVTNGSQGGTIYTVEGLLRKRTTKGKAATVIGQMKKIGLLTAKTLNGVFSELWEIGLDVAVDRKLRPWILEVNTHPDPCPFSRLPDRSMLRKMIAYGKANGRIYALKCTKSRRGHL